MPAAGMETVFLVPCAYGSVLGEGISAPVFTGFAAGAGGWDKGDVQVPWGYPALPSLMGRLRPPQRAEKKRLQQQETKSTVLKTQTTQPAVASSFSPREDRWYPLLIKSPPSQVFTHPFTHLVNG